MARVQKRTAFEKLSTRINCLDIIYGEYTEYLSVNELSLKSLLPFEYTGNNIKCIVRIYSANVPYEFYLQTEWFVAMQRCNIT